MENYQNSEERQTKKLGRPTKSPTLITQKDLIRTILQNNTNHDGTRRNSFTESFLTKAIGSYNLRSYDDSNKWNERGARSLIFKLRDEGCPIASENVINPSTNRVNKAYYWEVNPAKYNQWRIKNSENKLKKGAPK